MSFRGWRGAAGAALSFLALGCGTSTVVRVMDGREIEGPFIAEQAYFYYAAAANAEADGQWEKALLAYEEAAQADAESAAVWTGIGRMRCKLKRGREETEEAFEQAGALDADFAPLWRDRALCAKAQNQKTEALGYADKARRLDPDNEDMVLLHASLLSESGKGAEAFAELHELVIRRPASVQGYMAFSKLALQRRESWAAEAAARALSGMARGSRVGMEPAAKPSVKDLDALIVAGDHAGARKLLRPLKMDLAELALRAVALGRAAYGREQAELLALSDPTNRGAWMAYAVASDLERNEKAYERAIEGIGELRGGGRAPSYLALLLFTELLDRRIGLEAAQAYWAGVLLGNARVGAGEDALVARVEARVRKRLGQGR